MIRNICVTDCSNDEDYKYIVAVCEGISIDDVAVGWGAKSKYGSAPLYDDGGSDNFMYFWTNTVGNRYKCTEMTVQEFRNLKITNPELFV